MEADINISITELQTSSPQPLAKCSHGDCGQQTLHFAGSQPGGEEGQALLQSHQASLASSTDNFVCRLPNLIPGPRCYSDASLAPDSVNSAPRSAGLGIFLMDPTQHLKCFIRARIDQVSYVLMAESAAMALAAKICDLLRFSDMSFLTDSQILASFFNGPDLDKPPQWQIKPYTQKFLNAVTNCNWKVFKV